MNIFVSSTQRDLEDHRESLRLAIETSGHHFVGMEHFGANTYPALDVCFRELDKCEVYIGLLGSYYGSVPRGRVLSYTELEYQHARLHGKHPIVLVSTQSTITSTLPRERRENIQRLARFKAKIKHHHTVSHFLSPEDAAWRALAAIMKFEASKQAKRRP
ncbi:MAG: DUF4062 domain-containing protein [Anaerolineales bacterium]|nr:DUF4062 domain-containing protein [Anaerolineales bacterium]